MAPGLAIDPLFFRWVGLGVVWWNINFLYTANSSKNSFVPFFSFSFFFIYLRNPRGPMSRIGFKSQIDRREKKKKTKQKLFSFFCLVGNMGKKKLLQAGTR